MNQAKSLYRPFFRWATKRGLAVRNPMADFQLPTSTYVSSERTPPEADELCTLLGAAVEVVPDVAPLLVLGAATGMRRGDLVGIRRSRIHPRQQRITVDAGVDGQRVKSTKTRKERGLFVDEETMAMLIRLGQHQDEAAAQAGISSVDIGAALGRSDRWAVLAIRSAQRRAAAKSTGRELDFDGSVLALRKFTSTELLDAGFNISMVAQCQGHGTQVLAKHYAKGRRSADRKAASHLGGVVHHQR